MPTSPASPRYCAYLLRCWQIGSQYAVDAQEWRFMLEDPHTSARHSFASFDSLRAFLHDTVLADPCGSSDASADEQAG